MSWAITKKAINSDLNEPLNYLAWIQDLATFGESGYVYNDNSILQELLNKSKNFSNSPVALLNCLGTSIESDVIDIITNSETISNYIKSNPDAVTALDNSEPILIPIMTSNTTPSGVASASTILGSTNDAWKAFNRTRVDANDAWISDLNQVVNSWIAYEFTSAVWPYKIEYRPQVGAPARSFNSAKIQYEVDGSWESVISITGASTEDLQTFVIASAVGKHDKWRLLCETGHDAQYMSASILQFYCK